MILECQPNIVKDLPISCGLMNRWHDSLEEFARFGWESGLLPTIDGDQSMNLIMEPQDVIRLRRLRAIGERGWPLLIDDERVPPFDASRLGTGRYELYACLARKKEPTGEDAEFRSPDGDLRRYRPDVRPVLTLAINEDRLQHRDWIQVALFHRTVADGIIRTHLDTKFHPPIRDMAAYLHPNPLPGLAEDFLRRLKGQEETPLTPVLRAHLTNLAAIAASGHPQLVFQKVHLCLGLARELIEDFPFKDVNLESVRYSRESFCRFVQMLALGGQPPEGIFPVVLEVGGERYLRADGEFAVDGDFWVWRPSTPDFLARAMVIYMPHALSEVPFVNYGHLREEAARWPLARPVENLAPYPGSAMYLTDIQTPTDALFLRTSNLAQNQNLRLKLGEGHAVYYQ